MVKLETRYTAEERSRLEMLIKPVEAWTDAEYRGWLQTGTGFRHFRTPGVIPIEHFWPKSRAVQPREAWRPAA
jgi:hypothetical protein